MSQNDQSIQGLEGIGDAQRSRSRALVEQAAPPTPVEQNRTGPAPQVAEQARQWGGADTVKMSEEAMQAIHGRVVPDVQSVTALKAALESMIHQRSQNGASSGSDAQSKDEQAPRPQEAPATEPDPREALEAQRRQEAIGTRSLSFEAAS